MQNLFILMSICSFITNGLWLVAETTGPLIIKITVKLLNLLGILLPIIYWLKVLSII